MFGKYSKWKLLIVFLVFLLLSKTLADKNVICLIHNNNALQSLWLFTTEKQITNRAKYFVDVGYNCYKIVIS